MNKRIFYLLCCISFAASAQNAKDSLSVVSKDWKTEKIAKGVVWKQGHFTDLFDSEQEINYVEVDLKKQAKRVHLAADPKVLKTTSAFAEENRVLVAINGGFFDVKNGGAVDYIKVDGKVVNLTRTPSARANAVLTLHKKKITIQAATPENTEQSTAENVMLSGPLLVLNGSSIALDGNPFNSNRHPRTAMAVQKNHKLILIVVDGRNSKAYGMSLMELARVMKWLGAKDAMNLDGGGSSTLYIKGKGIVNYPSDNKQFDHEGQRKVANIVYLR
ncbi:phosphodiester glycosidase family protein [Leadbetterella sp. DM7]|uniref:phosphodiester glycosidase family protein n=1 Tax=Leadbetterella sp. DM7 TaxID=3235085 RepID=UPI00349E879D